MRLQRTCTKSVYRCSTDINIFGHPHYDTYHDVAWVHWHAFKVPDNSQLSIRCSFEICSDISDSTSGITSCDSIPSVSNVVPSGCTTWCGHYFFRCPSESSNPIYCLYRWFSCHCLPFSKKFVYIISKPMNTVDKLAICLYRSVLIHWFRRLVPLNVAVDASYLWCLGKHRHLPRWHERLFTL